MLICNKGLALQSLTVVLVRVNEISSVFDEMPAIPDESMTVELN